MIPNPLNDFHEQKISNKALYVATAVTLGFWLAGAVIFIFSLWMVSAIAETLWGY